MKAEGRGDSGQSGEGKWRWGWLSEVLSFA